MNRRDARRPCLGVAGAGAHAGLYGGKRRLPRPRRRNGPLFVGLALADGALAWRPGRRSPRRQAPPSTTSFDLFRRSWMIC